jgi:RES domain-containing protein
LKVPSAVVRGGFNYLLNPHHPGFSRLEVSEPEEFELDRRLA